MWSGHLPQTSPLRRRTRGPAGASLSPGPCRTGELALPPKRCRNPGRRWHQSPRRKTTLSPAAESARALRGAQRPSDGPPARRGEALRVLGRCRPLGRSGPLTRTCPHASALCCWGHRGQRAPRAAPIPSPQSPEAVLHDRQACRWRSQKKRGFQGHTCLSLAMRPWTSYPASLQCSTSLSVKWYHKWSLPAGGGGGGNGEGGQKVQPSVKRQGLVIQ